MQKYKLLFNCFFKKKKLLKFVVKMFSIITVGVILIFSLNTYINKKCDTIKMENIKNNYVLLSSQKDYKDVIKEIDKKYIKNYYPVMIFRTQENSFIYADNNLINLKEGNYPKSIYEIVVNQNSNEKINDIISINADGNFYNLQVVGIYESNDFSFSMKDITEEIIFASFELMEKIGISENELLIQVNDYKNLDLFLKQLNEKKEYSIGVYERNIDILNKYFEFKKNIDILTKVVMVFAIILIVIVDVIIVNDNKIDIAIMKTIGFSDLKICLLFLAYISLIFLMSLIFSLIISLLLMVMLKNIFVISLSIIVIQIIKLLLSLIFSTFFMFLIINKISIINLMNIT